LLHSQNMTPEEAHTSHSHGFELPDPPQLVVRNDPRPWRAVAGVALCLGLAGIVTGLIVAHRQSVSDEHVTSDALQREELRDGWKALGAAATRDALSNGTQPSAAPSATIAPPNVVIVNVPAQSAAAPPNQVTNITLPSGSSTGESRARIGSSASESVPAINFSPMQGYVPTQTSDTAAASDTPRTNYLPQNVYQPAPGAAAPYTPPVGNGSIPGSTPNPALPNNNGLVGSTPTPGPATGSLNGGVSP